MAEMVFNCPQCRERLSYEAEGAGEYIECPHCHEGMTVPEGLVDFGCMKCKSALCAPEALLGARIHCPNCDHELTVPKQKNRRPRLQFLNRTSDGRPDIRSHGENDALSENVMRVTERLTRDKKVSPWVRWRYQGSSILFGTLAFVIAFLLVVYLLPLKNTHEAIYWRQAVSSLAMLKSNPGDLPALRMLQIALGNTQDKPETREARSKLMAVYALGRLISGDERGGSRVCRYVEKHFPGSEAAAYVAESARMKPCPRCGGKATICKTCGGTGKCPTCGGTGRQSRKLGNGLAGTSGDMGPCLRCKGTGKCPDCQGTGSTTLDSRCIQCGGRGVVPSKEKLMAQYRAAIEDVTLPVRRQAVSSGFKRWLAGIQKRLYKVIPRRGYAGASNVGKLTFEEPEEDEKASSSSGRP